MLVQQRCFQSPDGASKISNFTYMNFQVTGKFVTVNYLLMEYDHGKYFTTKGPDKYEIKGHEIIVLKRNIWKYIPFNQ